MKTKHLPLAAALALGVALLSPNSAGADELYVSTGGNHTVDKFTPDGTGSLFADEGDGLFIPYGLAFDRGGNLFVADQGTNMIEKFTPGGVGSVFADASDGLNQPYGLAFDGAGNLFVANQGASGPNNTVTIEKFTPGGVGSVFATTGSGRPTGLAFDSLGNLYLGRLGLHADLIEKFTPTGVQSVFADRSSGLGAPWGLAFDSADNLFVTNISNNSSQSTIWKFTLGGVRSSFLGPINGFNPQGLAFDSGGNLFVASNGLKIIEFTPGGVSSVFSDGTMNNGRGPIEIAIRPGLPTPEPGTFALLGLGLPALLATRRRRSA